MDSKPISEFLESTYPNSPVPLTSELGRQIEAESRSAIGPAFRTAVLPREIHILTQRGQEYFRRTREAALGHRLEDLLEGDKEEQSWASVAKAMDRVGELIRTHQADGPFVLGARPSYTDFFITGSLQSARVVDEGVFQRIIRYPGFGEVYYACQPFMEKKT